MSNYFNSVLSDFKKSIGLNESVLEDADILTIELDNDCLFTIESVLSKDVVISMAKVYSNINLRLCESALGICNSISRSRMPLRVGLVQENRLVMSFRIPMESIDVTVLYTAFKKLEAHHGSVIKGNKI